jgi:hypothetical protein
VGITVSTARRNNDRITDFTSNIFSKTMEEIGKNVLKEREMPPKISVE